MINLSLIDTIKTEVGDLGQCLLLCLLYSTSRCYEVQEPHPQPPPISKVYPFLPPAAGGLRGVRGGGLR
ncbi:MAG: hypothetical protein WBA52_19030, partial [Dolichospermum sp.]